MMTSNLPTAAASSDASLLRADDPDAFRELYGRYANEIYGYFNRRTTDRTAALDLTAETFAQIWFGRDRFRDVTDGSAAPWIYGIARNILLLSIRKGALERRATERLGLQARLDSEPGMEDIEPDDTWAEGADELLDSLPADQREAVRLRVLADLSYDDIAQRQGTTPGNARVRVHRGLASLKRRFQ